MESAILQLYGHTRCRVLVARRCSFGCADLVAAASLAPLREGLWKTAAPQQEQEAAMLAVSSRKALGRFSCGV